MCLAEITPPLYLYCRTFTYGTGPPLRNGISGVIVLAITLMLGITLLVSVIAIIICAAKRFGRQNSTTQEGSVRGNVSTGNPYQPLPGDQEIETPLDSERSSSVDRFINRCIRWYSAPNE